MTKKYTQKETELADKLLSVIRGKQPSININGQSISVALNGKIAKASVRQRINNERSAFFR